MPRTGSFKRLKSEILRFLQENEIDKQIIFRLEGSGRQPYTEPIFTNEDDLNFENIRTIIIHYRQESISIPFELYHEVSHVILGKKVHIWLLMYSILEDPAFTGYKDRIMMVLHLLDLPVDDFLFECQRELVIEYNLNLNEQQLTIFNQLADEERTTQILATLRRQYGTIQSTSTNNSLFYDFIVITLALSAVNVEKYLDHPNKEHYLELHNYILDVVERKFNSSYPFREYFDQLKGFLSKYSFSIRSESDLVSYLSDCLESLEIPATLQNERGHMRLVSR